MVTRQVVSISSVNRLADSMDASVDGFLDCCRAKNLAGNTLGYYADRIRPFVRFMDRSYPGIGPQNVTREMIREFLKEESRRTSPSTANHCLTALRAFFGFLVDDGYLTMNPSAGVKKLRQPKRMLSTLTSDQVVSIFVPFRSSFTDVRDKALLTLVLDSGLRATEVCDLKLCNIDWQQQTMRVVGKGDKERLVPFGKASRIAITQYLSRRGQVDTECVFVTCYGEPLDRFRLGRIVKKRLAQAGIDGVRCSPHTLRHTFAVGYLRAGADVFSLQKILVHSDLTMTRRYTELMDTDVIERHRQFSPVDRLMPMKHISGRKRIV